MKAVFPCVWSAALPLLAVFFVLFSWCGRGRRGYLGGETFLHLKRGEPRSHWLQEVGQEVDGARHACRKQVKNRSAVILWWYLLNKNTLSWITFKKWEGGVWCPASMSAVVHAPVCKLEGERERRGVSKHFYCVTTEQCTDPSQGSSLRCQQPPEIVLLSVKSKHLLRYQIMSTMSLRTGSDTSEGSIPVLYE